MHIRRIRRISLIGSIAACALIWSALPALAAPGDIDTSFGGGDGELTYASAGAGDSDQAAGVAVGGGKIVMVGTFGGINFNTIVTRSNSNGTPDVGFGGGDGMVVLDLGNGIGDGAQSVAIDSSDRIVVAGTLGAATTDFLVSRFTTTGALDTTFGGGDGKAIIDVGPTTDQPYGIVVQKDGKIVIGGYSSDNVTTTMTALRLKSDGTPDSSFSGDGIIKIPFKNSPSSFGSDITYAKKSGFITVVGQASVGGDDRFAFAQLTKDGKLNKNFSRDGKQMIDAELGDDRANGVILDGSKIVASGGRGTESTDVVRLNANGSKDKTFGGGDGVFTGLLATVGSDGIDIAKSPTGGYVVATVSEAAGQDIWGALRLTSTGSPDPSFGGGDGLATFDTSSGLGSDPTAIAINSGQVLEAGGAFSLATDNDLALVQFQS